MAWLQQSGVASGSSAEPESVTGQDSGDLMALQATPRPEADTGPSTETVGTPLFTVEANPVNVKKRGRPRVSLSSLLAADFGKKLPAAGESGKRRAKAAPSPATGAASQIAAPAPAALTATSAQPRHVVGGRAPPPALMTNWSLLSQWMQRDKPPKDEKVIAIGQHFLHNTAYHLTSMSVLEKNLGIDSKTLQRRLFALCTTLCVQQLFQRHQLEQGLHSLMHPQSMICYLEAGGYDETPLKVLARDPFLGADATPPEATAAKHQGLTPGLPQAAETTVFKILQTGSSFGMLLKTSSGFLGIIGAHHGPLQSMGRASGDLLAECLGRSSGISTFADAFSLKCRSYCSDKAGYNLKGEQLLTQHRPPGWHSNLTFCDLHALAGVHKRTFELLFPTHISGLIHLSLCLRLQSSWMRFRSALYEVILGRLVLQEGRCPRPALDHKMKVLQLCADGSDHTSLEKMVRLLSAAGGDWQDREHVQVCWDSSLGAPPLIADIAQTAASQLAAALTSKKPGLWRRDKWTGFKGAVVDIWLLDQVHGLLQPTFTKFLELMGDGGSGCADGDKTTSLDLHESAMQVVAEEATERVGLPVSDAPAAVVDSGRGSTTWAAQNSKDRAAARKWLASDPSSVLTLMVSAMGPLEKLFHKQFEMSGQRHTTVERAAAAKAHLAGTPPPPQSSRLSVAADCRLEQTFYTELQALFEDTQNLGPLP